ncbi:MAG: hypothetical protein ACRC20_09445 [Segniliparus sp.]|uniref:hypothetical protein n=1 Tax=Segniliparus sp. TaxID=2804064 RepID=UPI003F32B0BA
MSTKSSLLSLFAVCAAAVSSAAPHAAAAPADPGCAALQQVQPDLSDLGTKFGAFANTVGRLGGQYQQGNLLGVAANLGDTGQKAQEMMDSLHQISGDLQDAESSTSDPGLRDSISKLDEAVNEGADDAGAYTNPFAPKPENGQLTSLAVRIGALLIGYQINYTRVCGIGQIGQLGQIGQPGQQGAPAVAAQAPEQN